MENSHVKAAVMGKRLGTRKTVDSPEMTLQAYKELNKIEYSAVYGIYRLVRFFFWVVLHFEKGSMENLVENWFVCSALIFFSVYFIRYQNDLELIQSFYMLKWLNEM